MRHILILLAVLGLLGTALAQTSGRTEALAKLESPVPEERARAVVTLAKTGRMTDVPALIARLRDDQPAVRGLAEQAVWAVWNRSGDPAIDRLFAEGVAQMESSDFARAIKTFTRIIELKPDFAEGWNKRATVYFLVGDYERSTISARRSRSIPTSTASAGSSRRSRPAPAASATRSEPRTAVRIARDPELCSALQPARREASPDFLRHRFAVDLRPHPGNRSSSCWRYSGL
jgi:tetratricopeptide (TPR) repeat protein